MRVVERSPREFDCDFDHWNAHTIPTRPNFRSGPSIGDSTQTPPRNQGGVWQSSPFRNSFVRQQSEVFAANRWFKRVDDFQRMDDAVGTTQTLTSVLISACNCNLTVYMPSSLIAPSNRTMSISTGYLAALSALLISTAPMDPYR